MKIFLDTSVLIKLYHKEIGTEEIENIFIENKRTIVFLSALAKIEFTSTMWKKVRIQEISTTECSETIALFENDLGKYSFVPIDDNIIEQANKLIGKYGKQGLRTLDSIQLSTSVFLRQQADLFITTDKLLDSFLMQENLPPGKPNP